MSKLFQSREEYSKRNSLVFFCKECKTAWESFWLARLNKFIKYPDFPSYGLRRKECLECKKEN